MDMKTFGRSNATVPTQTFASSNFIGTPVPMVGQVGVTPTAGNAISSGSKAQIALIVAALVVGGYIAHHVFFEK